MPAAHVGLAISMGLFVNAVFDPLIGSWSDRTRSRWGRRHPFMSASVLHAGGDPAAHPVPDAAAAPTHDTTRAALDAHAAAGS